MLETIATIGSGLAGAGASIFGSSSSARSLARAIKKQIAWEKERATNAHQWEVQDLKKAGLNPILSAGGQGAMTGGISAPTPDTTGYQNAGNILANMISSALDAQKTKADINQTNAATENTLTNSALQSEQIKKTQQETINAMREEGLIDAKKAAQYTENLLKMGQSELIRLDLQQKKATLESEIERLKAEKEAALAQKDIKKAQASQEKYNDKMKMLDRIVHYMGVVGGATASMIRAGAI